MALRGVGGVEGGEAVGESHFYALRFEVDAAEERFGEGDEDFSGGAVDDEQGNGAGVAVYVFDNADEDGLGWGDVEEGAAGEVGDVELIRGEGGALSAGDGDEQAGEGFGGGDGVVFLEMEDDGAPCAASDR